MQNTGFLLPNSVISTGAVTGNAWSNTANILLVDDQTADSNPSPGLSSDIIIGNFNFNIPIGATINGIEFEVIGYRGPQTIPALALTMYAVDDTSTVPQYYPYSAPFTGLTTSMGTYTFGGAAYMFATTWTVNQINNFKFQIVANGEVHIDAVLVKVYFTPAAGPTPPITPSGICAEELQTQPFELAIPLASTDTSMILTSFNYSDGDPIAFADFGSAGYCDIVVDRGIYQGEENVRVTSITPLSNGNVELGFTSLANRGLPFHPPFVSDPSLIRGHNTGAEVTISNNSPFYDRFLKKCHIDVLVSAPIEVDDEGVPLTLHVHKFNFVGAGVTAQAIGDDVNVVIPGAGGTTPPVVVDTGTGTSGNTPVTSLSYSLTASGVNRAVLVQISTEQLTTVSGVTFNGVALTQIESVTDAGTNLRSEQWILVNPPLGTHNVVVSLSVAAFVSSGAEALVNVNQITPVGDTSNANGTSLAPSTSVTTTDDNSLVFDSLATAITPIAYTVGVGQVLNWSQTANSVTRQGASSLEFSGTSPDVITMSYVITQNTKWLMTAVEIIGISSGSGGGVQSVTGLNTDNTDPVNPIVQISVDGVSITGLGTPGSPLIAAGSVPLEVQQNGVTVDPGVTVINITGDALVTNPSPGQVDIEIIGGGGSGNIAEQFDDFISWNLVGAVSPSTEDYGISGNFALQNEDTRQFSPTIFSEPDHPGIVKLSVTSGASPFGHHLIGFGQGSAALPTGSDYLLTFDDDFSIETEVRLTYSNPGFQAFFFLRGGTDSINILIRDGFVEYDIGGGSVVTSVVAPATLTWFRLKFSYSSGVLTMTLDGQVVFSGAVALTGGFQTDFFPAPGTFVNPDMEVDWVRTKYRDVASSDGNIIELIAAEDLSAGDTAAFATNIDDSAIKAVWSQRIASSVIGGTNFAAQAVCEIDTDKYVIAMETTGNYRLIVATLNRDTMTWSFGAVSGNVTSIQAGNVDLVKLDTDKFCFAYFTDVVNPYVIEVTVCTVAGTTITIGNSDSFAEPSTDNASNVQCVQLGTDRFAMVVGGSQAASHCDLFEVTVSGTTPTIGTQTILSGSTNRVSAITVVDTDKVAVVNNLSIWIATVAAGVWTVGAPVAFTTTTGDSDDNRSTLSLCSAAPDTVWLSRGITSTWRVSYFTISGTVPTLDSESVLAIATFATDMGIIVTDGTDVFALVQGDLINGVTKLTASAPNVLFSPFAPFNIGNSPNSQVMAANQVIGGNGYFGILQGNSGGGTSIRFAFHVQGMSNYYIGVVQNNVNRGSTALVKIAGVDDNQTGLTPGALYDPFEGGLVSVGTPGVFTLQAQSPTEVKV